MISFKKKALLFISSIGFISINACGLKSKNPLESYNNLQAMSEKDIETLKDNEPIILVDTDSAGQVALQNGVYQIIGLENLGFIEGKEKKFEFSLKFMQGKVKADIDESELLKEGFKVERLSQDINVSKYRATYTAPVGIIPSDKMSLMDSLKISLKDIQYVSNDEKENTKTKKIIESLALKTTDISYVVRRDANVPVITVNGLNKNLKVGTITKFSVDVTAPSNYKDASPLKSEVFYDVVNIVNSQGLVEANGAYFVSIDPENNKIVKIANNKWRMNYIFNTKDVQMLPQLDKNLLTVEDSDKLYVSLSFLVSSDKVAVSDKKTVRFYISLK